MLGLSIAVVLPYVQQVFGEEDKKEVLAQEEIDKKLDEILKSQKDMKKRVETILTQTQFLKAASGK